MDIDRRKAPQPVVGVGRRPVRELAAVRLPVVDDGARQRTVAPNKRAGALHHVARAGRTTSYRSTILGVPLPPRGHSHPFSARFYRCVMEDRSLLNRCAPSHRNCPRRHGNPQGGFQGRGRSQNVTNVRPLCRYCHLLNGVKERRQRGHHPAIPGSERDRRQQIYRCEKRRPSLNIFHDAQTPQAITQCIKTFLCQPGRTQQNEVFGRDRYATSLAAAQDPILSAVLTETR
jgi:hypothetical protein